MPEGICKLCLKPKPLVRSHLMPASLYGYCRAEGFQPLKVGGGIVMPTDRQTQDYLLCGECEELLNREGETWLTSKLATIGKKFPFYDLLTRAAPDLCEGGNCVYFAANNSEIKFDKLVHFAMGLFWKASVHPWGRDAREPRIELGPYSNEIRRWLLGEDNFPGNIALTMIVSPPLRAQITFNDPYEGTRQGGRGYFTHVPGILFMLSIGKELPPEVKGLCLYRNPLHPIMVSDDMTNKLERMFANMYLKSRKTSAYLRAKEKRDRNRGK